jgi:hypothetical protein
LHGVHGNPGESLVGAERLLRAVGRHRLFGLLFALVLLRFPAAERERACRSAGKADARIRTADPFTTSKQVLEQKPLEMDLFQRRS